MTPEVRNALRGVVLHCVRLAGPNGPRPSLADTRRAAIARVNHDRWTHSVEFLRDGRYHRDLVGAFYGRRDAPKGTCVWCRRPVEKRKRWHRLCVVYHAAARGLVQCGIREWAERDGERFVLNALWPTANGAPPGCAECGGDEDEIDHHLPLAVAHELGHRWAVRARLPGNLRWLCTKCHRAKTARDARLLAGLRGAKPKPVQKGRETPLLDPLDETDASASDGAGRGIAPGVCCERPAPVSAGGAS